MDLELWLDQPFIFPDVTVREIIRSVADKEGAHADPKYNDTLFRSKAVKYGLNDSHLHNIVGIAESLLEFLHREPLQVAAGIPPRRNAQQVWERV